jgi:dolichyl-phosphate-mannose-protein mannosyltransferase
MSSPQNAVRQRGGKRGTTPNPDSGSKALNGSAGENVEQLKNVGKEAVQKDWDYKLALSVLTVLAFITRFWGISHPNQVVFDEVHFGKVR